MDNELGELQKQIHLSVFGLGSVITVMSGQGHFSNCSPLTVSSTLRKLLDNAFSFEKEDQKI